MSNRTMSTATASNRPKGTMSNAMLRQQPLPYPAIFQCITQYLIPGRRKRTFTLQQSAIDSSIDIDSMGIDIWTQVTLQAISSDDEANDSEIDSEAVLQFNPVNPDPVDTTHSDNIQNPTASALPSFPQTHSKRMSMGRLSKRPSMQLDQGDGWYLMSDYSDQEDFPVDESFLATATAKQNALMETETTEAIDSTKYTQSNASVLTTSTGAPTTESAETTGTISKTKMNQIGHIEAANPYRTMKPSMATTEKVNGPW